MIRARLTIPIVGALLSVACSFGGDLPVNVAVRAVAVDLAFRNADLVEPVDPEVIVRIIPAPPEVASGDVPLTDFTSSPQPARPPRVAPPPTDGTPCPKAPPNRVPDEPASVNFRGRVRRGVYPRRNEGTFKVEGGIVAFTLPYPAATRDVISDVRQISPPTPAQQTADALGDTETQPEDPSGSLIEWDVRTEITRQVSVTDTYRFTGSAIALVKRESVNSAETVVFVPSPPVDIIQLNNGIGHKWRSAGVDVARRTALQVEGAIVDRKPVDLCGELVDGFVVETNETFVDLDTGATSGTTKPNVRHFATQFGGLIIRKELHYSETTRDPGSGAPIRITYDFVSTLSSPDPATPEQARRSAP